MYCHQRITSQRYHRVRQVALLCLLCLTQDRQEDHFSSPPGFSVNPDALSSTDQHQPTLPQRPMGGSPLSPLPHPGPSKGRFPSPPGFSVNPDTLSSTGHQPRPPQSPTGGIPLPLSASPRVHQRTSFPPGFSMNPDTLSSTGSTDNQPTPPQSPGVDPEIHSLLNLEPFPLNFGTSSSKARSSVAFLALML